MAGTKPKTKSQGVDIRGFFGTGGSSQPTPARSARDGSQASRSDTKGSRKVQTIEISDEDEPSPPKKPAAPVQVKKVAPAPPQKLKSERVMEEDEDDEKLQPSRKRKKSTMVFSSDEEDIPKISPPLKKHAVADAPAKASGSSAKPKPKAKESPKKTSRGKKRVVDDDFETSEDDDADEDDDDFTDDDDEPIPKGRSMKKAPSRKTSFKKPAEAAKGSSKSKAESKPKFDSKAEPKPKDEEPEKPKPKFNWAAAKAAKMAGPSAPGSKSIPDAADPNCLAGLSFVFTGELTAFSRDEAINLAKRFGGRVTLQPSSKTSYVVLGSDAGPSKLAAIKKNNLKTLDEDGFLNLIATRVPDEDTLDDRTRKKIEKEKELIRQSAIEMERREKKATKEAVKAGGSTQPDPNSRLWTDRYAPQSLKEICGNKGQVDKLQTWLHDWDTSLKSGFKKPGKNGMNVYRAILITGPPGIGKTTSAHLCAKLEGFTPIELNASDARSKKLVENSTNITNTSLDGWMGGGHMQNVVGVNITERSCLIMDEVDGMSAGDRGGVGALAALIKRTKIPIICIANDRGAQKLKPLTSAAFNLSFKRPEINTIRSRILSIAFKEKMKIPANVIDQLIEGSQSDIRQVLNMLSTWKLSSTTMDFDEGKTLAKANEKYTVMTPFNVINKMLGPYLFSPTSRETLNDKVELYFHDPSFMPLFMQENYLKTQPSRVKHMDGPEKVLKQLELMEKASASISDGDIVDTLIHGSEQHWSLMPLHAVCSTVRPAAMLYGMGAGYGGQNAMSFPQWLGQNSKQGKLSRGLTDVQARMRLKVSGDKPEIRLSYVPALFPHVVKPLVDEGTAAVDEVIARMDEYYLTREDWDTIVELGVDDHKDEVVLKKISTQAKTALTRKYNTMDHPIPFHKARDLGKAPKKLASLGPAPDLEEAFEVDDDVVDDVEKEEASEDDDPSHDSLIVMPKAKRSSAAAKGKGKATAQPKGKSKPIKLL